MIIDIFKNVIYNGSLLSNAIFIVLFSIFFAILLLCLIKYIEIYKNNYLSNIFINDFKNQELKKTFSDALKIKLKSISAKLFLIAFDEINIKKNKEDDIENNILFINFVINEMKTTLNKDFVLFKEIFNLLFFSAILITFLSITYSVYEILSIFYNFEFITLVLLIKPLFILLVGIFLSGLSSILYVVFHNKIDEIILKNEIFINEFKSCLLNNDVYKV